MDFDGFTGQIQHRLKLQDTDRAVRAIRATLISLGEWIPEGNAEDFAATLPIEIKWHMTGAVGEHDQRFDWREPFRGSARSRARALTGPKLPFTCE